MKKIRVAIAGYGNLGKGIENQINENEDMELVCIFTRRDPVTINNKLNVPVVCESEMERWEKNIDIVFLCGGSARDLPIQGPKYAEHFNIVDAFDTHQKALDYYKSIDKATKKGNTLAMTSIGWDPGIFSNIRLLISGILPNSKVYTFWGEGVSQGHSDAIRKIDGVKDARQYTLPIKEAINKIRSGETPVFTKRQMHKRVCYVVLGKNAKPKEIEESIKTMPYYFDEYETIIKYITQEELLKNHYALPHGGTVIGVGETTEGTKQIIELNLNLNSNPEFTAACMIAYGRAAYKMWANGERGYKNFSDVPPKYLVNMNYNKIIQDIL